MNSAIITLECLFNANQEIIAQFENPYKIEYLKNIQFSEPKIERIKKTLGTNWNKPPFDPSLIELQQDLDKMFGQFYLYNKAPIKNNDGEYFLGVQKVTTTFLNDESIMFFQRFLTQDLLLLDTLGTNGDMILANINQLDNFKEGKSIQTFTMCYGNGISFKSYKRI